MNATSVMSSATGDHWNSIWKDLAADGITDDHAEKYKEDIKAYMRYLANGSTPFWTDPSSGHSSKAKEAPRRRRDDERERFRPVPAGAEHGRPSYQFAERYRESSPAADHNRVEAEETARKIEQKAIEEELYVARQRGALRKQENTEARAKLKAEAENEIHVLNLQYEQGHRKSEQIRLEMEKELHPEDVALLQQEFGVIQLGMDEAQEKIEMLRRGIFARETAQEESRLESASGNKRIAQLEELRAEMKAEEETRVDKEVNELADEFDKLFEIDETPLPDLLEPVHAQGFSTGLERASNPHGQSRIKTVTPGRKSPPRGLWAQPGIKLESEHTAPDPEVTGLRQKLERLLTRLERAIDGKDNEAAYDLSHYAVPDVVERLGRLGVKTPNKDPRKWAICDHCSLPIVQGRHHCFICQKGDWDLCQACWDDGETCLDSRHEMEEIPLEGIKKS